MSDTYEELRAALAEHVTFHVTFYENGRSFSHATRSFSYDPKPWQDAANPATIAALLAERDALRALLVEWEDGMYHGHDFLRRVRLAIHGPLSKETPNV